MLQVKESSKKELERSYLYPRWMERVEEVRRLFASLIGASSKEVAFVGKSSEGLSPVASGLFSVPWMLINLVENRAFHGYSCL